MRKTWVSSNDAIELIKINTVRQGRLTFLFNTLQIRVINQSINNLFSNIQIKSYKLSYGFREN